MPRPCPNPASPSPPSTPQCNCRLSGQLVVLKVYKLKGMCDLQRVQLFREIRLHSSLQHVNVIQFYASFLVSLLAGKGWFGGLGLWRARARASTLGSWGGSSSGFSCRTSLGRV